MGEVTALFWDVGGVILSNGWDPRGTRRSRKEVRPGLGRFSGPARTGKPRV